MHDPTQAPHEPESFADLPIQPTGSGIQDLEIAYEQMRLSDTDAAVASDATPVGAGDPLAESEAHPS